MNFSGLSNQSFTGKFLRYPLRLIPPTMRFPILQGTLKGKQWIVGSGQHGCWLGSYEYDKQQLLTRNIAAGRVVFDLGSHAGFYTLLASSLVGPKGKVVAFEPMPQNLAYLKEGKLQVKTVSLDELIARGELPVPDYLKIDVEGAEMNVFTGAKSLLSTAHPTIFLATHGDDIHKQCCQFLTSLGYEIQPIGAKNVEQTDELFAFYNR